MIFFQDKLLDATPQDKQALKELIATRLDEGGGETLFEIGVEGTSSSTEGYINTDDMLGR